ncbi:MAG TPA: tetratricopeptide repeat protein [Kiritimatiellia bacterium]|nr:tetratricopeptide repeat protein [Kiritimatiellia bacterium]HMP00620.1 tetratricopeptide repeat protein [Kiritimatiellia bacterium]HMP97769.1 tetratricopeptide repeat protein [Kiritimatiellia bacterium]
MNKGRRAATDGRYDVAYRCFREAATLNPSSSSAWTNCGGMALLVERYDEAEACYRHALSLDAGLTEARLGLCRLHLRARRLQQAAKELACLDPEALTEHGAELHYLWAVLHEMSGNLEDAANAFTAAADRGHVAAESALYRLWTHHNNPDPVIERLQATTTAGEKAHPDPLWSLTLLKAFPSAHARWKFADSLRQRYPEAWTLHDAMISGLLGLGSYAYAALYLTRLANATPTAPDLQQWPSIKIIMTLLEST